MYSYLNYMHVSQNNLNLVFASLNRNSHRAFNKVLSNSNVTNKGTLNSNIVNDKLKTHQYIQKVQNAKELNKYTSDNMNVNGNIKKYYHGYNDNIDNKFNTRQDHNVFIPGKRQYKSKSIIYHRSSSINDLIKHPQNEINRPHCKGHIQSNIKNRDHFNKECFLYEQPN